jgi:hypothetical protein
LIIFLILYPFSTLYLYELKVGVEMLKTTYNAAFYPIFAQLVLKIISSDKSFLQISVELVEFSHQKYRKISDDEFII